MPTPVTSAAVDALALKLAKLALASPEEFAAVDVVVTAALERHQQTDGSKPAATLKRVK